MSKITHLTRMNIYSFIYLFFTNYFIFASNILQLFLSPNNASTTQAKTTKLAP